VVTSSNYIENGLCQKAEQTFSERVINAWNSIPVNVVELILVHYLDLGVQFL